MAESTIACMKERGLHQHSSQAYATSCFKLVEVGGCWQGVGAGGSTVRRCRKASGRSTDLIPCASAAFTVPRCREIPCPGAASTVRKCSLWAKNTVRKCRNRTEKVNRSKPLGAGNLMI
jgi:hypothetical protein